MSIDDLAIERMVQSGDIDSLRSDTEINDAYFATLFLDLFRDAKRVVKSSEFDGGYNDV